MVESEDEEVRPAPGLSSARLGHGGGLIPADTRRDLGVLASRSIGVDTPSLSRLLHLSVDACASPRSLPWLATLWTVLCMSLAAALTSDHVAE